MPFVVYVGACKKITMKKSVGVFAGLLTLASMGATPQQPITQSSQQQSARHNDAIDKSIAPRPIEDLKELHSSGSFMDKIGLSPKEYGQMLQRTGRQKWVKSIKR